MQLRQIATRLQRALLDDGFVATYKHVVHAIFPSKEAQDDFDARYGTDTNGVIPVWKMKVASPSASVGAHYGTAAEHKVSALLAPFPRQSTILDLGCGKGRILIIAARMGFARVIGLEFVAEWAAIARENLTRLGLSATVVVGDAAIYAPPPGALVVYLYDPFGAPVMTSVVERPRTRRGDLGRLRESAMRRLVRMDGMFTAERSTSRSLFGRFGRHLPSPGDPMTRIDSFFEVSRIDGRIGRGRCSRHLVAGRYWVAEKRPSQTVKDAVVTLRSSLVSRR